MNRAEQLRAAMDEGLDLGSVFGAPEPAPAPAPRRPAFDDRDGLLKMQSAAGLALLLAEEQIAALQAESASHRQRADSLAMELDAVRGENEVLTDKLAEYEGTDG